MSPRIAIIGSGISGLVTAYLLSKVYEVVLFEKNDYLGGHTHTAEFELAGEKQRIDTGFIVFNQQTYPHFSKLLRELKVETEKSEMSFSFSSEYLGLEYNGHNLNTLFADRSNIFNLKFYALLADIIRFNKEAKLLLTLPNYQTKTVAEFLTVKKYRSLFIDAYFIPMASAIWSTEPKMIFHADVKFILEFFENHGLLNIQKRPEWSVIKGGSSNYLGPLVEPFKNFIHLNTAIKNITRQENSVILQTEKQSFEFSAVVLATHSDQALKLLAQPTADEREILSAIPYQKNEVILHYDNSLLPRQKRSWASWNYSDRKSALPTVTYYMNRLQNLQSKLDYCVSLNQSEKINPAKIIQTYNYEHPIFTPAALQAQRKYHVINGKNRTYYCGAYWGNGFHEDGVNSALAVAKTLGLDL